MQEIQRNNPKSSKSCFHWIENKSAKKKWVHLVSQHIYKVFKGRTCHLAKDHDKFVYDGCGQAKLRRKSWKDMGSKVTPFLMSQYMSQGLKWLTSFTFKTVSVVNNITKQKCIFFLFLRRKRHEAIYKRAEENEKSLQLSLPPFVCETSAKNSLQSPQLWGTWYWFWITEKWEQRS